jgi:hypothetical protein
MVRVAKTGYLVAAGIAIAAALGAYVLFNSIAGTGGATQTADGNVTSVAADQPDLQLVLQARRMGARLSLNILQITMKP